MLYCLQLALIMLSIIYISFLVLCKTVSDLVHLKASREYPCEFRRAPYTMPACRAHHPAHAACALAPSCDSAWWPAYNAYMTDYMV